MSKKCDFYIDNGSKYMCMIKRGEISYSTYNEYCKYDDSKKCPIYQYHVLEKEGKL